VLDHLGRYLSILPSRRAAVLISEGGQVRLGERITDSLNRVGIEMVVEMFGGECSISEIDRVTGALRKTSGAVDCVIAVGGGKCLDAGKCIASRLSIPIVVCPTIASTDAPTSALSIVYTDEGAFSGIEFFPQNPSLVVVDTRVIADAPVRYLVAGMGDAVSTYYEARTCFRNPNARTALGGRVTLAANAIAQLCAETIYDHGSEAAAALERGEVSEAVERVVEANTLLSGVGFESGGLAAAHAVATALTIIPEVHASVLHGEMVAIGVLTQLVLEKDVDEYERALALFKKLGLPVRLGEIGLDADRDAEALKTVASVAVGIPIIGNEPFEVTAGDIHAAMLEVDGHA
jgi:glycerol dehydrogenase